MRFFLALLLTSLLSVGFSQAQEAPVATTETYSSIINNLNPFREYPFTVAEDGSTITLDLAITGDTTGQLDTYLYLVDAQGVIVAENDDRERGNLSSLIEYVQAEAGNYTAIATRYGIADGTSYGNFDLTISVQPGNMIDALPLFDVSAEAIAAEGFPQMDARPHAGWTVLAYYGGDNNLEWGLQFDFNEFELAGGSTDTVRVLLLLDRSPEHSVDNGDWKTSRVYEIMADVSADQTLIFPPTVDSEPLVDLGSRDSSGGELLAQFLTWGVQNYPADHYAVAIASHGAAWKGIVTDDSSGAEAPRGTYSIIAVSELREAFSLATQAANVDHFDVLINDACLMSSVEYFAGVAPYFSLSLASPEIVVDPALDMTLFVNSLKSSPSNPDLTLISEQMVDQYVDVDIIRSGDADAGYFTHAVTDLTQFPGVVNAVENFAAVFNSDPDLYAQTLGSARANAWTYTSFAGSTDKVDLGSLMRLVIANSQDEALINAATAVLDALNTAVVYDKGGALVTSDVAYYNIFFPQASADFEQRYFTESQLTEWGRLLRNYYNTVTPQVWAGSGAGLPFHAPAAPKITVSLVYPDGAISTYNPLALRMQIEARNVSHADATYDFVQADGTAIRLAQSRILEPSFNEAGESILINNWPNGVIGNDVFWDVALPVVTDGTQTHNELVIVNQDVAFLDGVYREPGSDTYQEVSVIFDNAVQNEDGIGRVQRVINRASGSNALAVFDIPVGSEFIALRSLVTSDGRVVVEPGNTYTWPEGGLTYTETPAPSGTYNVGMLMTAFGGTTGYAAQQVTVDNSAVTDATLRADTGLAEGYTITRPMTWSPMNFNGERLSVRSVSLDASENIALYFSVFGGDVDPNDLSTIPTVTLAGYFGENATWDGTYTDITIGGLPAIQFDFSYVYGEDSYNARAFAVYQESLGMGFVISAESVNKPINAALYDQLAANARVFPRIAPTAGDTAIWDFSYYASNGREPFTAEAQYPIPLDWLASPRTTWTQYTPGGDPASTTFIAMKTAPGVDARAALDMAVAQNVLINITGFNAGADRTLNGNLTWIARPYVVTRAGVEYQGRVYATVANEQTYLVWMETLNDESAAEIFARKFEPMIDGFMINPIEAG